MSDLRHDPAGASDVKCYRCGRKIGDAEFEVNDDGSARHFCCPPPGTRVHPGPARRFRRMVEAADYTVIFAYIGEDGTMYETKTFVTLMDSTTPTLRLDCIRQAWEQCDNLADFDLAEMAVFVFAGHLEEVR